MSRMKACKRLQQLVPTAPRKDVVDGGPSFSQDLFNNEEIVKIRNTVLNTKFIAGMVSGTLNPNYYGGYTVQDAAYCYDAVAAYDTAAKEMQTQDMPEFSLLYRVQSESYKYYNQEFVKTWHLKSTDSVVMGPAAAMYVGYEAAVSRQRPRFLAIAMLPCTMLWPWIANQLITHVNKNNPYYIWFEENKTDPDHKSHLEKFVDSYFSPEEEKEALDIFRDGMINELNFFREACNESLFYYSSFNM